MGQTSKPIINLALLGAQESGKSSLLASLLGARGEPSGTGREGPTVDCYYRRMRTDRFDVTVFDTPGKNEYAKNAATALGCSDCAVLVISAAAGDFESGIANDGATRSQALLAYTTSGPRPIRR